jgi:thioredoxin 1
LLTITASNFTDKVLNSEKPVLVYFWAEWCNPCKMMAPILAQMDEEFSSIFTIGKVNTDEEISLSRDHDIMSIPTMILFIDGKEVLVMTGAKNKVLLIHELKRAIPNIIQLAS